MSRQHGKDCHIIYQVHSVLMTKPLKMLNACPELWVGACEVWGFPPLPGTVRFACQGNDSLAREDHGVLWLSLEEGDSRRVLHA